MTGTGGVGQSAAEHAADLRKAAIAACDARRWDECKKGLDEAKDIDPGGEDDSRVRAARKALQDRQR